MKIIIDVELENVFEIHNLKDWIRRFIPCKIKEKYKTKFFSMRME